MLDLKKYAKRAEENPNFKAKLLENANQAIKEEFRENLPYKLKCKPKLVFEIEPMENLSENDVSNAAGGAPGLREKAKKAREWMKQFESGSYACSPSSPSNSCVFPVVNDVDLGGVAGASEDKEKGDAAFSNCIISNGHVPDFVPPPQYARLVYGLRDRNRNRNRNRYFNKRNRPLPMLEDMIKSEYRGPIGNQ